MFKISTIHTNSLGLYMCASCSNDYRPTPLRNRCRDDGVVHHQTLSLPQQMFFQLLYIMDPRTINRFLKDTPVSQML